MRNERPNKGSKGRTPVYSENFKIQVALEYSDGEYSCAQIAKKYNLPVPRVQWFVYWYRNNHTNVVMEEPAEPNQPPLSLQDSRDLEKKLALAEMKIAALEKVIALANQEYGTDLKKKAATK